MRKNGRKKALSSREERYLEVAKLMPLFTAEHVSTWFTGKPRYWESEKVLPRLVKKKHLMVVKKGKKHVYGLPGEFSTSGDTFRLYHGLQVTEILMRLVKSDPYVQVVPEAACKAHKWGIVPELGIVYPSFKAILLEFSTAHNVDMGRVGTKISRYKTALNSIMYDLDAEPIVLFVLDVPRDRVEGIVKSYKGDFPFMFTDYTTFLSVPAKKTLTSPIYLWSGDGKPYPLKNEHLDFD